MRELLCIMMLCVSCTDSKMKEAQGVLRDVEKPVNREQRAIISEIKPVLLQVAKGMSTLLRSGENVAYQTGEEFDEIDFSSLAYYELDENEFYADPSPENFMNCIHPAKDKYFFLGKKEGNIVIVFEAVRRDSKWHRGFSLEGMEYFKKNFSWIHDRLRNSDEKSVYFLKFLSDIYVACSIEGEPYFFNFIGTFGLDKKGFADALLKRKNRKDRSDEYYRKMYQDPEMMKQIEKNRRMTKEEAQLKRKKWEEEKREALKNRESK